ncbi:S-layer homology domain-containing protein, partial [bacterium]|nr:S-layer homology domain-containing protein [bacterium]
TLTINPGVVVKFREVSNLQVLGGLRALGTYGNPIYFTSVEDDAIKGDTNNNGASTAPMPGDWGRILFQDSSDDLNSIINYSIIRYGGKPYNNGGIELVDASPTIRYTTITLNQDGLVVTESTPTLWCNNIISNDTYGVNNKTPLVPILAQYHWWGSSTGPYHLITNVAGLGNQVSDGVVFSPWSGQVCDRETTFADVPSAYWAWRHIEGFYAAGITGGCATTPLRFCPDKGVTRAQMAVFLLNAKGVVGKDLPAATGMFSDVPANFWAAKYIEELARQGITSGCAQGLYCPDKVVTRAQMAVFLLLAKHGTSFVPPAPTGVFSDVPTDYWAAKWVEQLAAEGITSGCGTGVFCPAKGVTRAQMAVFMDAAFGYPLLP